MAKGLGRMVKQLCPQLPFLHVCGPFLLLKNGMAELRATAALPPLMQSQRLVHAHECSAIFSALWSF